MRFEFSQAQGVGAVAVKAISVYALMLLLLPGMVLAGGQSPVDVIRGATDSVLTELNAEPGIPRMHRLSLRVINLKTITLYSLIPDNNPGNGSRAPVFLCNNR